MALSLATKLRCTDSEPVLVDLKHWYDTTICQALM